MSFDAGTIAGKLGLDMSGYEGGMLRATAIAQLFPATVTNFLANPLLGLIGIAKDVGSAISNAFSRSLEEADKLNDMATNAGVAVEVLSGLGLAAGQAGSGVEEIADAFKFLAKNADDAARGNETIRGEFDRLGVRVTDVTGKMRPLEDLMFEVADGLAKLPDASQRSGAAMAILGRSGTGLIATLAQGSDALKEQMRTFENYGAVVTRSSADSADRWGDAMGEMEIAWRGLQNTLAEPLRDTLLPHLEELLQWVRTHQPEIRDAIAGVVDSVRGIIGAVQDMLPALRVALQLAQAALDLASITDPKRRFGDPYSTTPDPKLLEGVNRQVGTSAVGAPYLQKIAQGQLDAAEMLANMSRRGIPGVPDPFGGDVVPWEADKITAGLQPKIEEYRKTVDDLQKLLSRPTNSISDEEFDALAAKVAAFHKVIRDAMADYARLRETESKSWAWAASDNVAALDTAMANIRRKLDELRAARANVTDDIEAFGRKPGEPAPTTRPVATPPTTTSQPSSIASEPSYGGGGFSSPSEQPVIAASIDVDAVRGLSVLIGPLSIGVRDTTRQLTDFRAGLGDAIQGLEDDLVDLRMAAIEPLAAAVDKLTQAANAAASSRGGGRPGIGQLNVTTPPIDTRETSSQLADKMLPPIQAANDRTLRTALGGMHAYALANEMGL